MASKVIYTVLTGGYDRLEQPLFTDPAYDYVCFTDRAGQDGVWQLREIPFEGSPVMRARWAKMHPHILLPEYSFSIFMDANLCIAGPQLYSVTEKPHFGPFLHVFTSGKDSNLSFSAIFERFQLLEHPERDCVWEELKYCYLKDKVSTRTAIEWYRFLKAMGMPRHTGLAETNVLAREHNVPEVIALDNLWWEFLMCSGGSRDQLCLTPALYKLGLQPSLLLGPGLNARNVPFIKYVNHPVAPGNVPGKLNWANLKYNLRLMWRKAVLLCLK